MRVLHHVLAAASDGQGLIAWAVTKLNEIWDAMGLAYKVCTAGFLLFVVVFRRTIGKLLLALLLAGIGWWAVLLGGASAVANMIGHETPNPGITQQVTNPTPSPSPSATP